MHGHDVIVIGASAGGLTALKVLFEHLPADLSASVFIALHVHADSPALLPAILEKAGKMKVVMATEGARMHHGFAYVAPPDRHLMLDRHGIRLSVGPKENGHRPAVDPLFRSAAIAYGPRVVGVILSGMLDDGAAGLRAVKACRGTTLVQDPIEALYPGMPRNALAYAQVDYCKPVEKLASLLVKLASEQVADPDNFEVPESVKIETQFAMMERTMKDMKSLGKPAEFVCPSCHGALTEMHDGTMLRFRCHTGHAYSAEALFAEQSCDVEEALFSAVRAVDENAALARRIAERYGAGNPRAKAEHETKAEELDKTAKVLRKLIVSRNGEAVRK
jgi:two-component system chemotaxis response regulator CheB